VNKTLSSFRHETMTVYFLTVTSKSVRDHTEIVIAGQLRSFHKALQGSFTKNF